MEKIPCTDSCVVFAEHWPSWSFALKTVGIGDLKTVLGCGHAKVKNELRASGIGDSLITWEVLKKSWLDSPAYRPKVFIQGSTTFVEDVRARLDLGLVGSLSAITPILSGVTPVRFEGMDSRVTISHKSQGGVTRGQWTLHSQRKVNIPCTGVKRLLGHISTPVAFGTPIEDDEKAYGRTDRIPIGEHKVRVHVPSVYTRNKLVSRYLTPRELMDAYDLEIPDQTSLTSFSDKFRTTPSCAFVSEAPLKVLLAATRGLLSSPFSSVSPSPPPTAVNELLNDGSESSSRHSAPERAQATPLQPLATPDDVAVKHDDAMVDTTQWDRWSVDNFHAAQGTQPLVCQPGSFSAAHVRLFDGLRDLLLRRCRRNAFRGLCQYLRDKHGADLVPCRVTYKPLSRKKRAYFQQHGESSLLYSRSVGLSRLYGRGMSRNTRVFKVPSWTMRDKRVQGLRKRKFKSPDSADKTELVKDVKVGGDALGRLAGSSWWSWDAGSTLLFWRWPKRYHKSIRDGTPVFVHKGKLKAHFARQRWPSNPVDKEKMAAKLNKVRSRGYIVPGEAKCLTGFFAVPKADDIRIVYDATACGLNNALWAPNFFLPTIDSILRNADSGTWFGDIDLGEMFLNYFLDEELRAWAGVDVREIGGAQWERWERTLMGFRPSPYICTQSFGWSEDCIRGDPRARNNPLRWDRVILNLPGAEDYNPKMPWVYKYDSVLKRMASFFGTYIDDIRSGAASERNCRETTRRIASWANYFGQQDAARKRRQPARRPGAWAGAMCFSNDVGLFVTCTQKKWDKGISIIEKWLDELEKGDAKLLEHKSLEKDVGFLVHLSRTFPGMAPYLKGFYNTMNSWRLGRNEEGWKYSMKEWKNFLGMEESMTSMDVDAERKAVVKERQGAQPKLVAAVPRLVKDVKALSDLFASSTPAERLVRGNAVSTARFGFGDASGAGFGSSWAVRGTIQYRFGTWGPSMENSSSNLRELKNLVDTLKTMAARGELKGIEMFLFTDNSTAESAFYTGGSSSETLFNLILELRKLEMKEQCKIILCHCSGTRMIEQGSDGLSRGNLSEGVMKGISMGHFVPLHLNPFERCDKLKPWLESFMEPSTEYLDPVDWFGRGHDLLDGEFEFNSEGIKLPKSKPGTFVWSPAPAAGEAAIEELRKARQKSQKSTHVFIIPRLLAPFWRRHLWKGADLVVELPAGHPAWPKHMHEPLTLGFFFPYLKHSPWELRRSPLLLALGKSLCRVWKTDEGTEGPILRELWELPRKLRNLSPVMASRVLQGKPGSAFQNRSARKRRRSEMEEI